MNCDKTISQVDDPASQVNPAGQTASGREAGNGTQTPRREGMLNHLTLRGMILQPTCVQ